MTYEELIREARVRYGDVMYLEQQCILNAMAAKPMPGGEGWYRHYMDEAIEYYNESRKLQKILELEST